MWPKRDTFPVLLYHSVSREDDPYMRRFCVPPEEFLRQMEWLRVRDYRVVSLIETASLIRLRTGLAPVSVERLGLRPGAEALTANRPASPRHPGLMLKSPQAVERPPRRAAPDRNRHRRIKVVALSFDDGFEDFAVAAWPALKRYRFPATVFVPSRRVGQTNEWDRPQTQVTKPLLGWQALHRLAKEGVEVGSHGATHRRLSALPREEAFREVFGSRRQIAEHTGKSVSLLAYPFGDVDARIAGFARESGYLGAFIATSGPNRAGRDPFWLRRIEICGADSLAKFSLKITTGYSSLREWAQDWILRCKALWRPGEHE